MPDDRRLKGEAKLCSPHPWGSPLRAPRFGASVASLRCPILPPAELSRRYLTYLRAAERPDTGEPRQRRTPGQGWPGWTSSEAGIAQREVRAGVERSRFGNAREGEHGGR